MSNTAVGYKALDSDTIDLFADHLYQNAFHILDARRTYSSVLVTSRQTPDIPSGYTKHLVNPYRPGPKNPIRFHATNSSIVVICGVVLTKGILKSICWVYDITKVIHEFIL